MLRQKITYLFSRPFVRTVELSFAYFFYLSNANFRDGPMQREEIVRNIYHIGASFIRIVFGNPPIFFRGQKPESLQWGLWGFYPQAQTPTCAKEDRGNCYRYM